VLNEKVHVLVFYRLWNVAFCFCKYQRLRRVGANRWMKLKWGPRAIKVWKNTALEAKKKVRSADSIAGYAI